MCTQVWDSCFGGMKDSIVRTPRLPLQGKFARWATAAGAESSRPSLWAGLLFRSVPLHLTSPAVKNKRVWPERSVRKSLTEEMDVWMYLADSWRLYMSSGWRWPERSCLAEDWPLTINITPLATQRYLRSFRFDAYNKTQAVRRSRAGRT